MSTLMNSTCFPPNAVIDVLLGIPMSSKISHSLAPPQIAEQLRSKHVSNSLVYLGRNLLENDNVSFILLFIS